MKLRPLADRVIVKRLENETKTASGIVIPDNAAEKPDQGEVLAVGPGKKNDKGEVSAMNVKVGDRVLFGKYSGQTVKVDGDELLVMKEDDLFAVVEQEVLASFPHTLIFIASRACHTCARAIFHSYFQEPPKWQQKTLFSVLTPVTAWSRA